MAERLKLEDLAAGLADLLDEIQPALKVKVGNKAIEIAGEFRLSDAEGVYDRFQIRLIIPDGYPASEPKLYETAGRIPAGPGRHINPDGSCCFGVWEKWYLLHADRSIRAVINGPIQSYLLSQVIFELTGEWRFGEHAHGGAGLVEAGAELFSCKPDAGVVIKLIDAIVSGKVADDDPCPCGSGIAAKECHGPKCRQLHHDFSHEVLMGFRERVETQILMSGSLQLIETIQKATREIEARAKGA